MDAQRQLGAAQKETQAAQRDAMREAASVKPDSGMHGILTLPLPLNLTLYP